MKRNFINVRTQVDQMPLHNRSNAQKKTKNEEDIALSTHRKQVFLEKEIKSDDTLQSVSLEFNVPVAELKRINNIHKDNEIYARKIIKVPSNSLSILLESNYFSGGGSSSNSSSGQTEAPEKSAQLPKPDNCDVIIESVNNSCAVAKASQSDETTSIDDLCPALTQDDVAQESALLLKTAVVEPKGTDLSCNGADCGISWHALLFVTLVLSLGGPFIYVFWFLWGKKEKTAGS